MLGEALKKWRIKKGLTMEELGEQCGIAQASLSRYEAEERLPEPEVFKTIVSSLGVSYGRASKLYMLDALRRAHEKTREKLGVDVNFEDVLKDDYRMEFNAEGGKKSR